MKATEQSLREDQTISVPGMSAIERWLHLRTIMALGVFLVAFYFAYRYGMSFSHACASPFWFPDSVLLCALLLNRPGRWWLFVLAPLPIRLLVAVSPEVPYWFLWTTFAIDSAKGLFAAVLLRGFIRNPLRLESVHEFALYGLFAVLLVPVAAAFAGAAALHTLGYDYWPAWEQWFMGNALTHVVVTPAILYWGFGGLRYGKSLSKKQCVEGTLLAIGLIVTGYLAFDAESVKIGLAETRFYAPVPFLFWAAIRFGMFGASGAITIIAVLAVEAAIAGRGPFSGQSPASLSLALQHFLLLRAVPLYLVAILIEQKKGVERSLRESEARFRNMADTAPIMIWVSALDKKAIYFNQRWLDFTGRSHEEEMGDGWIASVHPEDVGPRVIGYQEAFNARSPFTVEYRLRRRDGEYRWILAHAVPRLTAGGEFLGYIGSCLDITDRKQVEEANRNLAHVARVSTMGQLSTTLAHELNQPLGAILRNSEAGELILQQEQPDYEEVRAILKDIRQDNQRAAAVIDRMRSLLKRRYLEFEALSLQQLLDQVTSLVRAEMASRRVALHVSVTPHLPPVQGDRVHLQQVLLNLLINGADAMNVPTIESRRLEVQLRRADEQILEVLIRDSGHGIAQEKLEHVFEPFYTTKSDGMGLGLAISKTIIEAHGGRIWAENHAEGGALFRFTLKIAQEGVLEVNTER